MAVDPRRRRARADPQLEPALARLGQELAEPGGLGDGHHELRLARVAARLEGVAIRLRPGERLEVRERVEPAALAADVIEPQRLRQLVAELAVDLDPGLVRGRLGLEDEAVEVEDQRADAHACVAYRP